MNKLGFAVVRENFRKERNDWKLDLCVGDGLQRQRPQGRLADEVLKHISSAKRHLQVAGASYYIITSHYRYF